MTRTRFNRSCVPKWLFSARRAQIPIQQFISCLNFFLFTHKLLRTYSYSRHSNIWVLRKKITKRKYKTGSVITKLLWTPSPSHDWGCSFLGAHTDNGTVREWSALRYSAFEKLTLHSSLSNANIDINSIEIPGFFLFVLVIYCYFFFAFVFARNTTFFNQWRMWLHNKASWKQWPVIKYG